jgi:hypothetical protein
VSSCRGAALGRCLAAAAGVTLVEARRRAPSLRQQLAATRTPNTCAQRREGSEGDRPCSGVSKRAATMRGARAPLTGRVDGKACRRSAARQQWRTAAAARSAGAGVTGHRGGTAASGEFSFGAAAVELGLEAAGACGGPRWMRRRGLCSVRRGGAAEERKHGCGGGALGSTAQRGRLRQPRTTVARLLRTRAAGAGSFHTRGLGDSMGAAQIANRKAAPADTFYDRRVHMR